MSTTQSIHFISIGGSVMHNLAIALQQAGNKVTGSDDEIYEPSLSRLANYGLVPNEWGWFPDQITTSLDAVIVGMHARPDNPELLRAQELGLKIYSYPEYLFEHSKHKQRIVIAGSHGKTTVTSMILHVLQHANRSFDYIVGAQLEGFSQSVRLSASAPTIILEGDEYLSSPIDPTPKFLHYQPHIAVVTGIAWDHFNVFPTLQAYQDTFRALIAGIDKAGTLIYDETDTALRAICKEYENGDVAQIPYNEFKSSIKNGKTYLKKSLFDSVPLEVFGAHNLKNISAAYHVCEKLGITDEQFYNAISSFKGASKRLEVLASGVSTTVYRDFAHAPSKVEATTKSVKKQFSDRKLVAVAELHTYSSLNKDFIHQYSGTLNSADVAAIFYSPHTLEIKKMEPLDTSDIVKAFNRSDLHVFTEATDLEAFLRAQQWKNTNLLLMSSGVFGGIDLDKLATESIA